jgi:diphosphomevalonate decarboxylase
MQSATAQAHPNIAFIKYWGNRDEALRLPANGSISMNLGGLYTRTTVSFQSTLPFDELIINDREVTGPAQERVSALLELVRGLAGLKAQAEVVSENNFPSGAGIASSASAFAALALAATAAAGLELSEAELSRLARRGSGSACRSIPPGFAEWEMGGADEDSFAASIAPPEHWDLVDCVAIVSEAHKPTGSTQGHALAGTSPLQHRRVADAPRRLQICRAAILGRDFAALAAIVEEDSDLMHAVMMSSTPALHYRNSASVAVMSAVREWRAQGMDVCSTVDAGANVHVICTASHKDDAAARLRAIAGVKDVLVAGVGGGATLVDENRRNQGPYGRPRPDHPYH